MIVLTLVLILLSFGVRAESTKSPDVIWGAQISCLLGDKNPEVRLPEGETLEHIKLTCLKRDEVLKVKDLLLLPSIDADGNQACVAFRKSDTNPVALKDSFVECNKEWVLIERTP